MAYSYQAPPLPKAFIWRRAHSLTGLWLVLFLLEHLLTNSQAALYIGENGYGFVRAVDALKNLPYLQAIEIFLLGVPFLIHGLWGVKYLLTSRYNNTPTDGTSPDLSKLAKNHAYTWQRVTSWILLFGIIAHVIHMRFLEYPDSVQMGNHKNYMIKVQADSGLYSLARRLDFKILSSEDIAEVNKNTARSFNHDAPPVINIKEYGEWLIKQQIHHEQLAWNSLLQNYQLSQSQVLIVSPSFGTIELMMVRETFKNPLMIVLYSGLVLAACFHAFNGLWTCMISWGITLTSRSQHVMRKIAIALMVLVSCLGLSAIWGTYWFNLNQ